MIIAETQMDRIPDNCFDCDLFRSTFLKCPAKQVMFGTEDYQWLSKQKPVWCPLREVEVKEVWVVE